MWSAQAVLVCALSLLGRSAGSFPPIAFIDRTPADVSAAAEAFVRADDPHIYLLTTSASFQRLQRSPDQCASLEAARKLASVLVHEEVHVKGGDEAKAYAAQLTTLAWLGAGSGTPLYAEVSRSMRQTLSRPHASLDRMMVRR